MHPLRHRGHLALQPAWGWAQERARARGRGWARGAAQRAPGACAQGWRGGKQCLPPPGLKPAPPLPTAPAQAVRTRRYHQHALEDLQLERRAARIAVAPAAGAARLPKVRLRLAAAAAAAAAAVGGRDLLARRQPRAGRGLQPRDDEVQQAARLHARGLKEQRLLGGDDGPARGAGAWRCVGGARWAAARAQATQRRLAGASPGQPPWRAPPQRAGIAAPRGCRRRSPHAAEVHEEHVLFDRN
jgi:hypothetical protein